MGYKNGLVRARTAPVRGAGGEGEGTGGEGTGMKGRGWGPAGGEPSTGALAAGPGALRGGLTGPEGAGDVLVAGGLRGVSLTAAGEGGVWGWEGGCSSGDAIVWRTRHRHNWCWGGGVWG